MDTQTNVVHEIAAWWQYERGGTIRSLAHALEVTPATLYYWMRHRVVPIKHLKKISELTEGVFSKERVRPDLF